MTLITYLLTLIAILASEGEKSQASGSPNENGPTSAAVPLAVQNLTFRILTNTSVNITWSKPQNNSGFDGPLTYIVECYRGTNNSNGDTAGQNYILPAIVNLSTTLTYVVVSNLTLGETYKFKIAVSTDSLGNVSPEKELTFIHKGRLITSTTPSMTSDSSSHSSSHSPTKSPSDSSSHSSSHSSSPSSSHSTTKSTPEKRPLSLIIGILAGVLLISSFSLVVLCIRRRSHQRPWGKNRRQNEIGLENVGHGEENLNLFTTTNAFYENIFHGQVMSNASSSQGHYENFHPVACPRTASVIFGACHSIDMFWEFPRDWLRFERRLGGGKFGSVSKATVIPTNGMATPKFNIVAVKMLKENASLKDRKDFLNEVNLMKKLQPHPHVVHLLGCCTQSGPYALILEYLSGGDLLGFLRKSRGRDDVYHSGECYPTSSLTERDLLSFAWMTADGMAYLAKNEIVHRDLAARNVLVGEGNVCKISDFGLARTGPYERKSKAWLPVKWMAPEDIFQGQCTSKSDVWSYGIMLWEIFTIGDSPYPRVKGGDVPFLIKSGYRMIKPKHVSDDIYSVMLGCWNNEPNGRPLFDRIASYFFEKRTTFISKVCVDLTLYEEDKFANFDASE